MQPSPSEHQQPPGDFRVKFRLARRIHHGHRLAWCYLREVGDMVRRKIADDIKENSADEVEVAEEPESEPQGRARRGAMTQALKNPGEAAFSCLRHSRLTSKHFSLARRLPTSRTYPEAVGSSTRSCATA